MIITETGRKQMNIRNITRLIVVMTMVMAFILMTTFVWASEDVEEAVTVSVDGDDTGTERGEGAIPPNQRTDQQKRQSLRRGTQDEHWGRRTNDWMDSLWRGPSQLFREFDLDDDWDFVWPVRHRNFLFDGDGEGDVGPLGRRKPSLFDRFRRAKEKMSKYFDRALGVRDPTLDQDLSFTANADLRRTDNEYELVVDVPGMEKGDLQVRIKEARDPWSRSMVDVLEVEGKRSHEEKKTSEDLRLGAREKQEQISQSQSEKIRERSHETAEPKYIYTERSIGQFQRKFALPKRILKEKIHASLKNGVLTVRVPIDPQERNVKPTVTEIDIE